jgi:hypothetical protein
MSEQARLSITEAAKLSGLSRTALYRNYINKGVLSVNRGNNGVFIELTELLRVFPDITLANVAVEPKYTQVDSQVHMLERENQLLIEQLKKANDREEWLKIQIDDLRKQQSYLLEDKTKSHRKKFLGIF